MATGSLPENSYSITLTNTVTKEKLNDCNFWHLMKWHFTEIQLYSLVYPTLNTAEPTSTRSQIYKKSLESMKISCGLETLNQIWISAGTCFQSFLEISKTQKTKILWIPSNDSCIESSNIAPSYRIPDVAAFLPKMSLHTLICETDCKNISSSWI